MASVAQFNWPWMYNFPPFFTRSYSGSQRDLEKLFDIANSNPKGNSCVDAAQNPTKRINAKDATTSASDELFRNRSIQRSLPLDGIRAVLTELEASGHIEWLSDKEKTQCFVLWKSVDAWANTLYKWASDNGFLNNVCTLYELIHGDDTAREEFHDMDERLLMKVLRRLQHQKRAEVIGDQGVKFF